MAAPRMYVTFIPQAVRRLRVVTLMLLGSAGMVHAQNGQAPGTVPGLETYSLPAQPDRPTPLQTPEPRIAPLPRPSPTATPVAPATPVPLPSPAVVALPPARPRAQPAPRPTPSATPGARPAVPAAQPAPTAPEPVATESPVAAPVDTPVPVATPAPAPPAAPQSRAPVWWAVGIALAALIAGVLFYRRRRSDDDVEDVAPIAPAPAQAAFEADPLVAESPVSELDVSDPAAPDAPRPRVDVALEVKRAGTNLLSAAVEYRVILRNDGAADAHGIALDLRLFGVEPGLEPAIEALFAAPLGRPVVARFDLAAGATAALEGTAMLPRDVMPPLPIQGASEGRVLFVPVMTVNLHYGWNEGVGQTAASFVVGLDRGADAKLGPFRLDGAPRMHDRVRLLPFPVERRT